LSVTAGVPGGTKTALSARRHQTMRAASSGTAEAGRIGPGGSARAAARRRRAVWEAAMGYAFVAPAVLLFLLFQGYPILRSLTIAFTDYRYLVPDWQPFTGVDNWVKIWSDATFWQALGRSATFTVMYVPALVLIGLLGAVLIGGVRSNRE